jgi:hypothetical protein
LVNGWQERKESFMAICASLTLCTVAALFVGGVAFAQQTGTTSGSAAGKNVEPSTATQKKYGSDQQRPEGGAVGGGAPGIEAKPGVEGGAAPQSGKYPQSGK